MIIFNDIVFGYDEKNHLFQRLSFQIKKNNFCAILGRSGMGKSSILYLIAGIEQLNRSYSNRGQIKIRDKIVDNKDYFLTPEKRNIAMVFQTPSLFSHKNILENICFGMKKIDKERAISILKEIKMESYIYSYPHQLSVGQQQRIAFARALLSDSEIILLDEPFSGLDFESKFLLYNLLLKIKHESQKTIILVTHDFDEAVFFANQFLIISEGAISEYNSIEEIYFHPQTPYIASLFEFANIIDSYCDNNNMINTIFGNIIIDQKYKESHIKYVLRPEDLEINDSGVEVEIKEIKFFGSHYILIIKVSDKMLFMKLEKLNDIKIGDKIRISLINNKEIIIMSI